MERYKKLTAKKNKKKSRTWWQRGCVSLFLHKRLEHGPSSLLRRRKERIIVKGTTSFWLFYHHHGALLRWNYDFHIGQLLCGTVIFFWLFLLLWYPVEIDIIVDDWYVQFLLLFIDDDAATLSPFTEKGV